MYQYIFLLSLLLFLIRWSLYRNDLTSVYYSPTPRNLRLLEFCKTLHSYSHIPFWGNFPLVGGYIQSIYASQIRKGPEYGSLKIHLEHENEVALAVHWVHSDLPPEVPIICVVPGIAGHYHNDYIKNFVHVCSQKGKYRVMVKNWPGCGDSPLTGRIIPFGEVRNLEIVINMAKEKYPNAPIFAVGFSAGSSLLARYLGEMGEKAPISCAVIMSNGYDAEAGVEKLTDRLMLWAITKKLKDTFKQNMQRFEKMTHLHPPTILSVKTIKEFDEHFTLKLLGKNAREYYQSSSCYEQLQDIKIPTLLLNAHDDPIVHHGLIEHPKKAVNNNHNLILATTVYGGHLGWLQGGFFQVNKVTWAEKVAMEFIEAVQLVQEEFCQNGNIIKKEQETKPVLEKNF